MLNKIARESGFVKRTPRKLTPRAFLEMMFFNVNEPQNQSLSDYSMDVYKNHGKEITKQSISERFNESAVTFLKSLIKLQLDTQVDKLVEALPIKGFKGIVVEDSTKFSLPDYMQDEFPGCGGVRNSTSMLSTHLRYELIHGHIEQLQINSGRVPDQQLAKDSIGQEKKEYLYLRDMGYFSLDFFENANDREKGGYYYISRFKSNTSIFEKKDNQYYEMDLGDARNKLKSGQCNYLDLQVYIGKKKKIPTRIVITMAPEDVVEERLRKVNKQNKSHGCQTTEQYRMYAQLNIYITNLDMKYSPTDISRLYRLRWQIELIFKTWKSTYKLNRHKQVNPIRIKCQLYACLLLILLHWEIFRPLTLMCFKSKGLWLSKLKFTKRLRLMLKEQRKWLRSTERETATFIRTLYNEGLKFMTLEKRKKRENYSEIIRIFI